VQIQVERTAETLSEDHRARAAAGRAGCRGALAQPAQDGADEDGRPAQERARIERGLAFEREAWMLR